MQNSFIELTFFPFNPGWGGGGGGDFYPAKFIWRIWEAGRQEDLG